MAEEEKKLAEMSFEAALAALQETVSALESGEQNLEQSLALFERGQVLAKRCQEMLATATLRVEQLTEDGEIVARD